MSSIEIIGMNNLLNCILVMENIRPSMLIQPVDYSEVSEKDKKTKSILDEIKKIFPKLKQSNHYQEYQGIIISKKNYNNRIDISLEEMGKILGYPCYKDFNNIYSIKKKYKIGVYVNFENREKEKLFVIVSLV